MRIALLSSTLDEKNGYGNITREYCSALHANGIDFTLFLPRSEEVRVREANVTYRVACVLPTYLFTFRDPRALLYFRSLNLRGYTHVHSLLDFPYCVIGARSARKWKLPFIMGSQGTYGVVPLLRQPDRWAMEYAYRTAKHIIVPSEFTKNAITKFTSKPYPISVIHNGVRFERFAREHDTTPIRAQFPGKTILMTVGGLKERKGQDLTIAALAIARKEIPDLIYVLVGDGPWKPGLQEHTRTHGVAEHVHFLGSKDGDDLVAHMQACDIYVHTPKVVNWNFEGFGIVYLEASACGKPIVATDAGGVRDAVRDGETGIIAPDGDVEAVARAIVDLCRDPQKRSRMGSAGKAYAQQHDWPLIVDQFLPLYGA